jgi:hypothetical protein
MLYDVFKIFFHTERVMLMKRAIIFGFLLFCSFNQSFAAEESSSDIEGPWQLVSRPKNRYDLLDSYGRVIDTNLRPISTDELSQVTTIRLALNARSKHIKKKIEHITDRDEKRRVVRSMKDRDAFLISVNGLISVVKNPKNLGQDYSDQISDLGDMFAKEHGSHPY